jgi:DNA-binding XRE family transcriptional regulator
MRHTTITKTQLPVIRRNLGMTIAEMAKSVGLKDGTYYYYETRFAGDSLPNEISDKIVKLARKNRTRIPRANTIEAKRSVNQNGADGNGANGGGRKGNGARKRREESVPRAASRPDLLRAVRETIASLQKLETALTAG